MMVLSAGNRRIPAYAGMTVEAAGGVMVRQQKTIRPSFNGVQDERIARAFPFIRSRAGFSVYPIKGWRFRLSNPGPVFPLILNSVEGWAETPAGKPPP